MHVDVLHLAIMGLSVLVGVAVKQLVPRSPLSGATTLALGIAAVSGGVIGAKLPFFLEDPSALQRFDFWLSDGRTVTWALAGGYLGVELTKLALAVREKTGDGFAAPVAASIAVGRVGCFQGGCCYGVPTTAPWGVDFGDGLARHPTQLYEAAFHALAAVVLVAMARTGVQPRQHFKLYFGTYCLYRFVTEWLRPEPAWFLGLTFYQFSVAVFFLAMVAHYVHDARLPAPSRSPS